MGAAKDIRRQSAPYGWKLVEEKDGRFYQPEPEESWVVRYIRQLAAFGCDPDEIAEELRRDEIKPRHGGRWTRQDLIEILEYNDELLWRQWKERVGLFL